MSKMAHRERVYHLKEWNGHGGTRLNAVYPVVFLPAATPFIGRSAALNTLHLLTVFLRKRTAYTEYST